MDLTVQNRLSVIAETYKQQKFRLPKPQMEEAASLLVKLLTDSASSPDVVDKFVRILPPDATGKALRDTWPRLTDEQKNQIEKSILNLPRSDRFDRLKLVTAAAVTDVDAERGVVSLCRSCASLDAKPGGQMSTEVISAFRKSFLEDPDFRLEKLNIKSHPSSVTGPLLGCLIQSLFCAGAAAWFQLRLVKWIFKNQAYDRLKPAQQTQLVEVIKRWNPEVKGELSSVLETIPTVLETALTALPEKAASAALPPAVVPPANTPEPPKPEPLSPKIQWKPLLQELEAQIGGLDRQLVEVQEQLRQSQEQNEKLRSAKVTAEKQLLDIEAKLTQKTEESERTAETLATTRTALADATTRADSLDAQITELKRKHQEEVAILNSRIETEAAHRLDGFKHNIARGLRVDYADFKLSDGKPMTPELGQGLRHLVDSIFDGLQKHGINAKQ